MEWGEIVEELGATLGAAVQVEWAPPPLLPLAQRARLRAVTRSSVLGCRACPLGPGGRREGPDGGEDAVASSPVPMALVDLGPVRNGLVTGVVGEGPGKEEDAKGVGFVGASGRLLRSLLYKAGFDQAWMLNVVACRPPGNRTPAEDEIQACRANLDAQVRAVAASGVRHFVLAGAVPTRLWRPDLRVTQDHGAVGVWRDHQVIVMPIVHPAAALRKKEFKYLIEEDLEHWAEVVEDGTLAALGTRCTRCLRPADCHDDDGVPWCQKHADRYQPPKPKRRGRKDPGDGQGAFGDDWGVAGESHRVDAD